MMSLVFEFYQVMPVLEKYYRVDKDAISYVVMDCPPDKENLDAFIKISDKLQKAKINVPKLFECNEDDGFLVISDLGDNLYSKNLIKRQCIAYTQMLWRQLLKCKLIQIYLV